MTSTTCEAQRNHRVPNNEHGDAHIYGPSFIDIFIAAAAFLKTSQPAYGSNSSTSKEAMTAMKEAETLRTELIDRINLHTVAETGLKSLLK